MDLEYELDLMLCPQPGCAFQSEILDRYVLESTDGPIEHVRIRCPEQHYFNGPIEVMERYL